MCVDLSLEKREPYYRYCYGKERTFATLIRWLAKLRKRPKCRTWVEFVFTCSPVNFSYRIMLLWHSA